MQKIVSTQESKGDVKAFFFLQGMLMVILGGLLIVSLFQLGR
jgi:hypothetical protein